VAVECLGGWTLLLPELSVYTTIEVVGIGIIGMNELIHVMTCNLSFEFSFGFGITYSGV
jgi:hypothetical protein